MEVLGVIWFSDQYSPHLPGLLLDKTEDEQELPELAKVLVVDDERLLADTTAAILRRAGFNVKTAYDGFGALESMSSFRPSYLVTDIMMPGMNGVELAITIATMYPTTKILLFSGQAGIADIVEESRARGFRFPLLAKPVHPTKLIEGLEELRNS